MHSKLTISKQITSCYHYVDLAERSAIDCLFHQSNRYWERAAQIAMELLDNNEVGCFLDEEYYFLKQIAKYYLKD